MCTLRNFPNQIEHCIEYGRDLFNRFFFEAANDLVQYIEKPQPFLAKLKQNSTVSGTRQVMEDIKKLVDMKTSANFDGCIAAARLHFESYFNHQIENLIQIFPHDAKDKEG